LLLLLGLHSVADLSAQTSIAEAIEAARKARKELIILRIDTRMIGASMERNFPSAEKTLDSILNRSPTGKALAEEYLIYGYDPWAAPEEDNAYMEETYFYDYSPYMIMLDGKGQPVAFIPLSLLKPEDDLAEMIDSTRRVFDATAKRRTELDKKYRKGKIDAEGLLELIHLRTALKLRSRELWNHYPTYGRPIPKEGDRFPAPSFVLEDFDIDDPFLAYLLEADSSYLDQKLSMVNALADLSYEENRVDDYTVLATLLDSLTILAFSVEDDDFSPEGVAFLRSYLKDYRTRSMAREIQLYARNNRTDLLAPAAAAYTARIRQEYKTQKAEALQLQDELLELLKPQLIDEEITNDSSAITDWESFKATYFENESKAYDRSYAIDLNQIAWAFYENVSDTALLAQALEWAQLSVNLDSQPYNNDTVAHLYAATGDKALAVRHQSIAVDLASKDPAYKSQLAYFKVELEKFRAE
jgi:hypothetical protein